MDILVGVRPGPKGSPSPLLQAVRRKGGIRAVSDSDKVDIGRSRLSEVTRPGRHRISKSSAKALAEHLDKPYGDLFVSLDIDEG